MPTQKYLEHPGINQSKLKKYLENPAKLFEPEPDSEAEHFVEGKLFEDLCFGRGNKWTVIRDKPGRKGSAVHAEWELENSKIEGKKCTQDQFGRMSDLAETARALRITGLRTLAETLEAGDGIRNKCIFIGDLKCEVDLMLIDQANKEIYAYDLKTTRRAITDFNADFWDNGYWIQELHYRNLIEVWIECEFGWQAGEYEINFDFIVGSKLDGCAQVYNWGFDVSYGKGSEYEIFYSHLLTSYRNYAEAGFPEPKKTIQVTGQIERKPWALIQAQNKLQTWV